MDSVHANIRDLEELRGALANGGATIQEIRQHVLSLLGRLSEGWRDAQHDAFVDAFLIAESALGAFVKSSETYGRYLQRLIQHLEEYLGTSLGSNSPTTGTPFQTSQDWHRDLVSRDVQQAIGILGPIVSKLYSAWSSLTPPDRLEKLQDLQSRLALSQSRKIVPLVSSRMPACVLGVYDGRQIRINQDDLASPERFWQILDTLIHEDRHAYQHWSLLTPGFHTDPDQVRAWTDNWEHYLDPKEVSLRRYRSQPIENDAFWFAESVVLGIIGRKHVG